MDALLNNHSASLSLAPTAWKNFIKKGRNGIKPLMAKKIIAVPKKYEQLQCNEDGNNCIKAILNHYERNPTGFEACAVELIKMMDNNFENFDLTRPW